MFSLDAPKSVENALQNAVTIKDAFANKAEVEANIHGDMPKLVVEGQDETLQLKSLQNLINRVICDRKDNCDDIKVVVPDVVVPEVPEPPVVVVPDVVVPDVVPEPTPSTPPEVVPPSSSGDLHQDMNVPETVPPTSTEDTDDTNEDAKEVPKEEPKERPVRYVEVLLFSDYARVQQLGARQVAVLGRRLMNNIASYYLNAPTMNEFRIVMSGHYMFDKGDPYKKLNTKAGIVVTGNRGLLQQFLNHVNKHRSKYPAHDSAMLLSNNNMQYNIRGLANVESYCTYNAGGINMVTYSNEVLNSVLVAHELGHTLGLMHDPEHHQAIMNPYVQGVSTFSRASIRTLNRIGNARCLRNNPMAAQDFTTEDPAAGVLQHPSQETNIQPVYNKEKLTLNTILLIGLLCTLVIGAAVSLSVGITSCLLRRKQRQEQQQAMQQVTSTAQLATSTTPQETQDTLV